MTPKSLRDIGRDIDQSQREALAKKLKKLYGKHLDSIKRYRRRPKSGEKSYEYSAVCLTHGVISDWTPDLDKRTQLIREHLKGAYDG